MHVTRRNALEIKFPILKYMFAFSELRKLYEPLIPLRLLPFLGSTRKNMFFEILNVTHKKTP